MRSTVSTFLRSGLRLVISFPRASRATLMIKIARVIFMAFGLLTVSCWLLVSSSTGLAESAPRLG